MRTVTYKEVLRRTATAMGWDPEDVSAGDQAAANVFIQRRAEFSWEAFPWPELCPVEKRAFRTAWTAATYAARTELYHRASRSYYVALVSTALEPATLAGSVYVANTAGWAVLASYGGVATSVAATYSATTVYVRGNRVYYPATDKVHQMHAATAAAGTAPTDASKWGEVPEFQRTIDYEQAGETAIGEVLGVWASNPRVGTRPRPIDYDLQDNGVRVHGSDPVVWVKFIRRCPAFSGTTSAGPPWLYDATATYAAGQQVYDSATGDFYRSVAGANTGNGLTDTDWWERLLFPRILANYVAQGASADLKGKADGQPEVYPNEAEEGYQILLNEFDKIERLQGQAEQLNVVR